MPSFPYRNAHRRQRTGTYANPSVPQLALTGISSFAQSFAKGRIDKAQLELSRRQVTLAEQKAAANQEAQNKAQALAEKEQQAREQAQMNDFLLKFGKTLDSSEKYQMVSSKLDQWYKGGTITKMQYDSAKRTAELYAGDPSGLVREVNNIVNPKPQSQDEGLKRDPNDATFGTIAGLAQSYMSNRTRGIQEQINQIDDQLNGPYSRWQRQVLEANKNTTPEQLSEFDKQRTDLIKERGDWQKQYIEASDPSQLSELVSQFSQGTFNLPGFGQKADTLRTPSGTTNGYDRLNEARAKASTERTPVPAETAPTAEAPAQPPSGDPVEELVSQLKILVLSDERKREIARKAIELYKLDTTVEDVMKRLK